MRNLPSRANVFSNVYISIEGVAHALFFSLSVFSFVLVLVHSITTREFLRGCKISVTIETANINKTLIIISNLLEERLTNYRQLKLPIKYLVIMQNRCRMSSDTHTHPHDHAHIHNCSQECNCCRT